MYGGNVEFFIDMSSCLASGDCEQVCPVPALDVSVGGVTTGSDDEGVFNPLIAVCFL